MVPPRGIEPRSSVLQTGAMTTSAKAAKFGTLPRIRTATELLLRELALPIGLEGCWGV